MNLKQLNFVLQVAQTRSFSRAAENACATQPTLSNAISQLEEELGGKLFSRTTRRVDLTPFGEYMLPYVEQVLQSLGELQSAAGSFHNPSHKLLRIGFSPLVDMKRLDQALAPFRQAHPDVTIFFKECFIDELSMRMEKGQIDIEIIPSNTLSDSESAYPFYQDRLCYLPVSEEAQATSHLSYKITDLPPTPIIMTGGGCGLNGTLTELLNTYGVKFEPYPGQALTYKVIEDWASLGIGAGILPKGKVSPENKATYPLFIEKDKPATFQFIWKWKITDNVPQHITDFLQYIKTTVPLVLEGQAKAI